MLLLLETLAKHGITTRKKHSININSRITNHINTIGKKPKTLNMIDDSELANVISVAVSLCRENNVEIDDLLNNKSD